MVSDRLLQLQSKVHIIAPSVIRARKGISASAKLPFRSCSYKDTCLACGKVLEGRGTKRIVVGMGYVCYGYKSCKQPDRRESLLKLSGAV